MQRPVNDQAPLTILHVTEVHWGGVVSLLVHFVAEQVAAGHEVHVLAHADLPTDARRRRRPSLEASTGAAPCRSCVPFASSDRRFATSALTWSTCTRSSPVSSAGCRLVRPAPDGPRSSTSRMPGPTSCPTGGWVNGGVRVSERLSARATDLIVANGPDELTRGEQIGRTRAGRGVGVAVDLDVFHPPTQEERRAARAELGLGEERVALILGRLIRQKGQDLLLPEWEREHPADTTLALVGPG